MTDGMSFATWAMRDEITNVWQACFSEKLEAIDLFFKLHFDPQNTLVYRNGGKLVAMTHMIPGSIVYGDNMLPGHYIYAAATMPEYRSKGLMGTLLGRAAEVGLERGQQFSYLLPSEHDLYSYYSRHGYVPFFRTNFISVTRQELQLIAREGMATRIILSPTELLNVRDTHITKDLGSAVWGAQAIAYAVGVNEIYGGTLICSQTGEAKAYALCAHQGEHACEIIELMADKYTLPDLLASVLHQISAESFKIRMPSSLRLFEQRGSQSVFGMLKPLTPSAFSQGLRNANSPYLGLTLD